MKKATSLKSSLPPSELNALAPLRVGGLARGILEAAKAGDLEKVKELAQGLLDLEPHIHAMLIERAEGTPELP